MAYPDGFGEAVATAYLANRVPRCSVLPQRQVDDAAEELLRESADPVELAHAELGRVLDYVKDLV